jgi:hypothetical protein
VIDRYVNDLRSIINDTNKSVENDLVIKKWLTSFLFYCIFSLTFLFENLYLICTTFFRCGFFALYREEDKIVIKHNINILEGT